MNTISMQTDDPAVATTPEGNQRLPIILFLVCFIASALGGTVSTLMSVYLPVAVGDLLGTRATEDLNYISAYINALFIFGWALGGFTWGIICDRIGRKKALLLAIGSYGLFTVLTGIMPNWFSVVLCRFMSGFGVGGVLVISFTMLSEVWPHKTKAVFTGILSIAFPVGIFSAGLINFLISSWRTGFLIGLIPLAISVIGIWLIKESVYWKKHDEQKKTTNILKVLFSSTYRKDIVAGSIIFGTMLIGLWAIFLWLPTWVQSLITTTDGQKERGLSMMLLGIGGLTGGIISGWIANSIGFRKAMLLCFFICAVMSFILFKTNLTFSPIIYGEIAILALSFGASQGILSAFIPQLFPVSIRASATGFSFNIGRLFTATAVLFVGVLVTAFGGFSNSLFAFSLVFIIGLLVILFGEKSMKLNEK